LFLSVDSRHEMLKFVYSILQTKITEVPEDLPEVVNDFDIEEDEIAIENRLSISNIDSF